MRINHTMSTSKTLTNLCAIKQSLKTKSTFAEIVYSVLVVKKVLGEHKETCLKINNEQTVKLRSGSIKFKNHFQQLAVPFKICADFECNVKRVKRSEGVIMLHTLKNIKHTFVAVLLTKLFVWITDSASQLFFIEEKVRFIVS